LPAPAGTPPRRIRDLPGPPGLPGLGNLLELRGQQLHQVTERWARAYGAVYRARVVTREFVVVSDPEMVATILRDRPDGFGRTDRMHRVANELGFNGVFSANGADWRRQRPMVLNGLDPTHVRAFFPTLVKVTERLARRWQRAADAGSDIDLQAELMRYTVDVSAGLAFGADINTIESDGDVIQAHLDKILPALFDRLMAPLPYWRHFKLPRDRALDRHLKALTAAVQGFIAETRARLAADPALRERPANLIEAMVAERDRPGSPLTDADVAGNVLTILLAGEDTTANTLAWMVWFLHQHPAAATRASDEVRSALAASGSSGSSGSVAADHRLLAALPYIEACAHEAMRLKPVAPVNTLQAARDSVVGGVALPAGTLVICLMRPAAVDARHFPDPQAFRPERWLAAEGGAPKRVAMPFGAGPRICPGRYLALEEIKMVMAMLLGGFDIASVRTPDGGPAQERMSFTMSPVGLRLRLRLRAR
jgi:cytochrome P450